MKSENGFRLEFRLKDTDAHDRKSDCITEENGSYDCLELSPMILKGMGRPTVSGYDCGLW